MKSSDDTLILQLLQMWSKMYSRLMEADTCSKVTCVIFLPCSERIQKMRKAQVIDQAVFLPSDWLGDTHHVPQHCTYMPGVREPRGTTNSSKTWGNLPSTVINCRSSQPTVCVLLLSSATIHLLSLISPGAPSVWKIGKIRKSAGHRSMQ